MQYCSMSLNFIKRCEVFYLVAIFYDMVLLVHAMDSLSCSSLVHAGNIDDCIINRSTNSLLRVDLLFSNDTLHSSTFQKPC